MLGTLEIASSTKELKGWELPAVQDYLRFRHLYMDKGHSSGTKKNETGNFTVSVNCESFQFGENLSVHTTVNTNERRIDPNAQ